MVTNIAKYVQIYWTLFVAPFPNVYVTSSTVSIGQEWIRKDWYWNLLCLLLFIGMQTCPNILQQFPNNQANIYQPASISICFNLTRYDHKNGDWLYLATYYHSPSDESINQICNS